MRRNYLILFMFCLVIISVASGAAFADGAVLGLSPDVDELELYKSPKDEDPAHIMSAGDLSFPTPILGTSNNGMYKIMHNGAEYWVISDDVESDVTRKIDTACDPKMAGSVVAHGKRGASEACQ